ncbi:hypothetical protein GCM10010840_13490 [Deinococcus aerolatus]|uniref:Transposase n=1 Tax=Deinococcus aerolatus TaxID=522487 RepID=A0ABQ2G672_9DEIO|nr:hypothetical protein GCM10010840_13490 [Deinococcus aerolatus]
MYKKGMSRAESLRSERAYRIEPEPRYTPQIGALAEMMNYVRLTTLQAVEGLKTQQLDTGRRASTTPLACCWRTSRRWTGPTR